jgi:hypothetical protein
MVTDAGGPVITNAAVDLIFWGSGWNSATTYRTQITNSVGTIMNSPYLSGLSQYRGVSNGSLLRTDTITSTSPGTTFTDAQVQTFVRSNINSGVLPGPGTSGGQILYMIIPQPGSSTGTSVLGQHGTDVANPGRYHYGWTVDFNTSYLDGVTNVYSHELVEAVTDAEVNYRTAFYVPSTLDEISDGVAQSYSYRLNGVLVQSYLSQQDHAYIGPSQWEDTFVVGPYGSIYDTVQLNGSFWSRFQLAPVGSTSTTGGITAVSRSPHTIEVWWVGSGGSVEDAFFYDGSGWNGFQLAPAGSASTTGGITAVSRVPGSMEVWWVGPGGSVEDAFYYDGSGWGRFQLAPAGSAFTIGAFSRDPDIMEVWWINPDGSVHRAYFDEAGWHSGG